MLTIKDITFAYSKKKKKLFDNFTWDIKSGSIYGLLGKNGTGKSTLLYLMTGLLRPQTGSITFEGEPVSKREPSVLRNIYLLPEIMPNINLPIDTYRRINAQFYPEFSDEQFTHYLELFEITDVDSKLTELSMGQRKKVFISFALATNCKLIFMDEPTNGLDIPSKSQFRKVVATAMDDKRSIVISTHQVRDINQLLDIITIIDRGKVLLNESSFNISSKLLFQELPLNQQGEDEIYSMPSLSGNSVISLNKHDEDSNVNLETLFNAVLEQPEKIQQIFQQQAK